LNEESQSAWKVLLSGRVEGKRRLAFCVYDEPSRQACLHAVVYLANEHHRADKRDVYDEPSRQACLHAVVYLAFSKNGLATIGD